MSIVYACAGSHAPGIRAWADAAPSDQLERFFSGYEETRDALAAAKPDAILLLTSEHWANFFLDHVGAFCLGRGESFEGPVEPWLKVEKSTVPGHPEVAEAILNRCYAEGFELNYSHELKLDHGSMVPLSFLTPGMDIPVVPLFFNTLMTPRPTARRCLELGRVLRPLLAELPQRIAVVATGGLSHDPGEVGHGRIDTDFDNRFLQTITGGDLNALGAYTDEEILAAGAGTLELLAWICLAGVMEGTESRVVAYEPIKPWATGVGVISYDKVA